MPGTSTSWGFRVSFSDDALHLGDDDAAVVVGGHGEIERAEIGAFMLEAEIAALVRTTWRG